MQVVQKEQIKQAFISNCNMKQLEIITGDAESAKKFLSDFLILAEQSGSQDYQGLAKCAVEIASLKLPINKQAGQAYIVPRGGKLNIEIGYKGWLVLAKRAGYAVKAFPIYKGDLWGYKVLGFNDVFEYSPSQENVRAEKTPEFIENNLEMIFVVCKDLSSGEIFNELIEFSLLRKLRSKSAYQDGSFYRDWLLEMYKAKAIKYALRKLPIDTMDNSIFQSLQRDDENDVYTEKKQSPNLISNIFSQTKDGAGENREEVESEIG